MKGRAALAWWLFGVVPVLIGGLVYIGWRSQALLFWSWSRSAGIEPELTAVRDGLRALVVTPPDWVLYSLPDALWTFALAWTLMRMTRGVGRVEGLAWLSIPFLLGPGAELAQLVGLPGTFDVLDLVSTSIAVFAVFLARFAHAGSEAPKPQRSVPHERAQSAARLAVRAISRARAHLPILRSSTRSSP